ncbi:MAG: translation initiation factor IF-3 [Candidatus Omnitrophota bacterium]
MNEMIREDEIRLVDQNGEHMGVISVREALEKAQAAHLDLVEVSAKSKPHVCRIMDFGHYKYEQAKKVKEAKKKQKHIVVKEIKLRPRIDEHDYDFKLNHAMKFLEHGDKVRFILQFRGREMAHKELGRKVMDRIIEDLDDMALVEQSPKQEGRFMNMTLAPSLVKKKRKERAANEELAAAAEDQSIQTVVANEEDEDYSDGDFADEDDSDFEDAEDEFSEDDDASDKDLPEDD